MSDADTRAREIEGLLEASSITGCESLTVIAVDEEAELAVSGKIIRVIPAWKWLLL